MTISAEEEYDHLERIEGLEDDLAEMRSYVRIAIQAARELYAERGEDDRTGELCRLIIGALEKSE